MAVKDAWILRLRDEVKGENNMSGEWYFDNKNEDNDFLTMDTNVATLYFDKEKGIRDFKNYEQSMIDKFGNHAICNFGYTSMMKNFEFVEVTVSEVEDYPI
ncbi:hypothetical protein [Sporosarcina sp. FSL K6-5500]|uniref:hypothetical protein n=1 Tax=Sporosarcina sp. FSL K6-5500 TaxID=2921558 RepID=UPI0030F6DA1E